MNRTINAAAGLPNTACLVLATILASTLTLSASGTQELVLGTEFHVAASGNDANAGTASKPFATLERARDEIRLLKTGKGLPAGGITVTVHGGVYELSRAFELTAEDAGTESAPIVYRARQGDDVRLSGGKHVTAWKPVTDPAVLERLDPTARGQVVQADMSVLGVKDFGEMSRSAVLRLQPSLRDRPAR